MVVATGLELVLDGASRVLDGKRIGLIANPTTVDRSLVHAVDRLTSNPRFQVVALFGPEHGIRGDAQDMISVAQARDPRTGLPVYSLYGSSVESLSPTDSSLEGVDALVFDIQDVGSRYYTYVWTMVLAMRVCARLGIEFVVLDRPNPLGVAVEGGAIRPGFESFVGLCDVANRHGLTAAEIATWMRARENLDVELTVVEMRGYRASMYFEDTGLPWVMPSPNMPTRDTALVYPGMCLIEGTEMSEGRGTTRPFEIVGAPYVDGGALASELGKMALPGCVWRSMGFLPTFQKHARVPCGGVQLHVTDRDGFRPYLAGVAVILATRVLWPEQFAWRAAAYEFVDKVPAIDLLTGGDEVRRGIEEMWTLADLRETWQAGEAAFREARAPWLRYQ